MNRDGLSPPMIIFSYPVQTKAPGGRRLQEQMVKMLRHKIKAEVRNRTGFIFGRKNPPRLKKEGKRENMERLEQDLNLRPLMGPGFEPGVIPD